jgi:hypothetical protein
MDEELTFGEMGDEEAQIALLEGALAILRREHDQMADEYADVLAAQEAEIAILEGEIAARREAMK